MATTAAHHGVGGYSSTILRPQRQPRRRGSGVGDLKRGTQAQPSRVYAAAVIHHIHNPPGQVPRQPRSRRDALAALVASVQVVGAAVIPSSASASAGATEPQTPNPKTQIRNSKSLNRIKTFTPNPKPYIYSILNPEP
jgi:hypothetical protein